MLISCTRGIPFHRGAHSLAAVTAAHNVQGLHFLCGPAAKQASSKAAVQVHSIAALFGYVFYPEGGFCLRFAVANLANMFLTVNRLYPYM
jgi:hypothetical protein